MSTGSMYSNQLSRLLAVPVVAAGIIGGTTVGQIATARADEDDRHATAENDLFDIALDEDASNPDAYSNPASAEIPWDQWVADGMATVPQVDIVGL
jgi:hypothetical protein